MAVKVIQRCNSADGHEVDMKFEELYKNATKLTDDWLRNECEYSLEALSPSQRNAIYNQYYLNMCSAVNALLYLKPTSDEIEELLNSPITSSTCYCRLCRDGLATKVVDSEKRKYLFRMAQYDQLTFDIANGRTAMLRDENMKWIIAPDALNKLDMLGFCQRTYAVKW